MLSHSATFLNRKKSFSQDAAITKNTNRGAFYFFLMFGHAIYTVIFALLIELF